MPIAYIDPGSGSILIQVIIAVVVVLTLLQFRKGAEKVLVVEEWGINENGPVYIRIKGRKNGFIPWLLSLCGLSANRTLTVNEGQIEFTINSSRQLGKEIIPLSATCNIGFHWGTPLWLLICGILLVLIGLCLILKPLWFLISCITGGCMIASYFLGRRVSLYIIPDSGSNLAIRFRPPLRMSCQHVQAMYSLLIALIQKNYTS